MADYKFNKKFEQRRLNDFWDLHWPVIKIEKWYKVLEEERNWSNFQMESLTTLLADALKKMTLEKLITEDKLYNMLEMVESPDPENVYVALLVIQQIKITKFKRQCQTKPLE